MNIKFVLKPTRTGKNLAGEQRFSLLIPQSVVRMLEHETIKEFELTVDEVSDALVYKIKRIKVGNDND